MYIQSRTASACYKLLIGLLATVGLWLSLLNFGLSAWRLFSTYILALTAVYYLLSALIITLRRNHPVGKPLYASLDGGLIVCFALMMGTTVTYRLQNLYLPGAEGWHAALIYFVLPFLVLTDWLLFTRKGAWRPMEPTYWLAGPAMYCSAMILTAEYLSPYTKWLYPLEFMNYLANGITELIEWLLMLIILVLICGYSLVLVDFVMSGKLSKYIVLPRIKTIPLDDEDPVAANSLADAAEQESYSESTTQSETVYQSTVVEIKPQPEPAPTPPSHTQSKPTKNKTSTKPTSRKPPASTKATPRSGTGAKAASKPSATKSSDIISKSKTGPKASPSPTKTSAPSRKPRTTQATQIKVSEETESNTKTKSSQAPRPPKSKADRATASKSTQPRPKIRKF